MTASPVAVALIGYGYAARVFHKPLLYATPTTHLHAIVSRQPPENHEQQSEIRYTAHITEVLEDSAVELVVIATPNDTHFPLAAAALRAGKHVVVDKPFTLAETDALQLIHLAQQHGCLLSVFQNRRWDGDFLTVQQVIQQGTLGQIAHVESHFSRYRPDCQMRWREQADRGGGLLWDLGPHLVDQTLQLFGPPISIFADVALRRRAAHAIDDLHLILRYPNHRVVLHADMLSRLAAPRFQIHGTEGSFIKHGVDVQESRLAAGVDPTLEGWSAEPPEQYGIIHTRMGSLSIEGRVPTRAGNYRAYYEEMAQAIRGERAEPPVSAQQALLTTQILSAAQYSADKKMAVPIVF